ncbi:MAG: gamma-glutamylcyclotransferase, partial [Halofilum sp. (in: g-proteobacteria)]|nr:gamma-glutamylcyclotransferase [Halofilum sp. (in: g-proteobacteria)]
LWVFAYGSLLWRPGFPYRTRRRARLHGYHRALRVWSVHHRGTDHRPGLVLGLDRGGCCVGTAFEVAAEHRRSVAEYLWEREMVTSVYVPRVVPVHVDEGEPGRIPALTFVLDREHPQYAGSLSAAEAVRHVRAASGLSGDNPEYVRETVRGLERIGIDDHGLRAVVRLLDGGD